MILLKGREVSLAIKEWVASTIKALQTTYAWTPTLLTVQIGDNPASEWYIRNQIKACEDVGISVKFEKYPEDIKQEDFLKEIEKFNCEETIDGIIIQTPLPDGWEMNKILTSISPEKDVEGVHPENLGQLYLGRVESPKPCTAWAALALLEWYGMSTFENKNCLVIGRSVNVGRAAALMLMHRNATVTICHTKTSEKQFEEAVASADVIIAAAGVAGIISNQSLSERAWIVDVGTNVNAEGKLVGDVSLPEKSLYLFCLSTCFFVQLYEDWGKASLYPI